MPKLEKTREVNARIERVYEIMKDYSTLPIWNIVVTEAKQLEPNKFFFKTNVGDVINTEIENIPNERMTSTQEGSPMQKIGYIFKPKGDKTDVTIWTEFELEEQKDVLAMAADLFLKSLIVYVDFLEAGGKPEEYKKKFSAIQKA